MEDDARRAILREHGEDPPAKGRLAARWRELADSYGQSDPVEALDALDTALADDYDMGVTAADFPPDEPDEPETPAEERRPARVTPPRTSLRTRLSARQGRKRTAPKGKPKAKGKPRPRIPVDRLCEHFWDGLARLVMPMDYATGRCLSYQAPISGILLEDLVRGTFVDRALQPIARAEEKGRVVLALFGPPMCVAGLRAAQGLPDGQRQIREALLVPMLRESMVLWVQIAGDKIEEKAKRDAELGPIQEQVDNLLAMIFAPPAGPPPTPDDQAAAAAQATAGVG